MDAIPQIPQGWVNGLFAALVGVLVWLFRKHDKKLDTIGDNYVTRKELADAVAAVNSALAARDTAATVRMDQMHVDNTANFRELRLALQTANSQLFDLAGRIPK